MDAKGDGKRRVMGSRRKSDGRVQGGSEVREVMDVARDQDIRVMGVAKDQLRDKG